MGWSGGGKGSQASGGQTAGTRGAHHVVRKNDTTKPGQTKTCNPDVAPSTKMQTESRMTYVPIIEMY